MGDPLVREPSTVFITSNCRSEFFEDGRQQAAQQCANACSTSEHPSLCNGSRLNQHEVSLGRLNHDWGGVVEEVSLRDKKTSVLVGVYHERSMHADPWLKLEPMMATCVVVRD